MNAMGAVVAACEKNGAVLSMKCRAEKRGPKTLLLPMLINRCRAAEECLDSFIDTAAGSRETDPRRSTHNSEPTSPTAMNFDRDALSLQNCVRKDIGLVSGL